MATLCNLSVTSWRQISVTEEESGLPGETYIPTVNTW